MADNISQMAIVDGDRYDGFHCTDMMTSASVVFIFMQENEIETTSKKNNTIMTTTAYVGLLKPA